MVLRDHHQHGSDLCDPLHRLQHRQLPDEPRQSAGQRHVLPQAVPQAFCRRFQRGAHHSERCRLAAQGDTRLPQQGCHSEQRAVPRRAQAQQRLGQQVPCRHPRCHERPVRGKAKLQSFGRLHGELPSPHVCLQGKYRQCIPVYASRQDSAEIEAASDLARDEQAAGRQQVRAHSRKHCQEHVVQRHHGQLTV